MSLLPDLTADLARWGYGLVFAVEGLESMGAPLPGESLLVAAALYAAATHRMSVHWLCLAAIMGAVAGDNLGYWIGHRLGGPLLVRYGSRVGLTQRRLDLGRRLFRTQGPLLVSAGRFVALLRTFVALLAGATAMPWPRFVLWNTIGDIAWSALYCYGAYFLGDQFRRYSLPAGLAIAGCAAVAVVAAGLWLRRKERQLTREPEAGATTGGTTGNDHV